MNIFKEKHLQPIVEKEAGILASLGIHPTLCGYNPFIFSVSIDWEKIKIEAEKDGYFIVEDKGLPVEDLKIDKVCIIKRGYWAEFLHRKIWKKIQTKEFHRHRDDDKPAFIAAHHASPHCYSNVIEWAKNGECSREVGNPAHISDCEIIYAVDGKWHREDGAARISTTWNLSFYENHKFIKRETL